MVITMIISVNVLAQKDGINVNSINSTTSKKETMDKNENNSLNPETIVKSLIEAMTSNDAEQIRSLFHEEAKQAYGNGSWKSGEDFFSWLQSDIIDRKGHVNNAKFSTEGNQVVVTGQYKSEGYTNKADFLFVVKDSKISSWQMRY